MALCLFTGANFFPGWFTLIPGGVVAGVAVSSLWVGQSVYLTQLALLHARLTGGDTMATLSKFNGISNAVLSLSGVSYFLPAFILYTGESSSVCDVNITIATLDNSTILVKSGSEPCSSLSKNESVGYSYNESSDHGLHEVGVCGPNHCPYLEDHIAAIRQPPTHLVYIFLGFMALLNALAILVSLLLPQIQPCPSRSQQGPEEDAITKDSKHGCCAHLKQHVVASARLLRDPKLLLLIPSYIHITVFLGTVVGSFSQVTVFCFFCGLYIYAVTMVIVDVYLTSC